MTFGDQVMQFALSTDIVDQSRFQRVMDLIHRYTKEALQIHTTKLMLECETNGRPGLMRRDLNDFEFETSTQIQDDDGNYVGQAAYAFAKQRPMWIVSSEEKGTLGESASCRDMWSGLDGIPPYRSIDAKPSVDTPETRTSVIIPITQQDRVVGVLNFETGEYVEITRAATTELKRLASCVSRMLRLYQDHLANQEGSTDAIDRLQDVLSGPLPKLTKPKVFLASSVRADQAVIDTVVRTLESADQVDLIHWERMHKAGNIIAQLQEAIGACEYGICYFSEKQDDGYRDNLNVVFEAGMFNGRTGNPQTTSRNWIPVRERQGPELPFDLQQERILWVDRTPDGALDAERFEKALGERLFAMIAEEVQS